MQPNDILELLLEIPKFKPLLQEVFKGLKEYEDEYEQVQDFLVNSTVNVRSKLMKGFLKQGFSEEAALALTIASVVDYQKVIERISAKNS